MVALVCICSKLVADYEACIRIICNLGCSKLLRFRHSGILVCSKVANANRRITKLVDDQLRKNLFKELDLQRVGCVYGYKNTLSTVSGIL